MTETTDTVPVTMSRIGDAAPPSPLLWFARSDTTRRASGATSTNCARWVIAAPTTDAFSVATASDWRPARKSSFLPRAPAGVAKDRMDGHESGVTCTDWFFFANEITLDEILPRDLSPLRRPGVRKEDGTCD